VPDIDGETVWDRFGAVLVESLVWRQVATAAPRSAHQLGAYRQIYFLGPSMNCVEVNQYL
jgi:hypothetical protein